MISKALVVIAGLLSTSAAMAVDDASYPISVDSTLSGESAIPASSSGMVSRAATGDIILKLHLSCFGTNLRGVGNPISPNAVITGNFGLNVGGTNYSFFVKFPGELVAKSGVLSGAVQPMSADYYGGPGNPIRSAGVFGNTIVLNTAMAGKISVDANGTVHEPPANEKGVTLRSYTFNQEATCVGPAVFGKIGHSAHTPTYPCGQFMGKTGVLATVFRSISVSADQSQVDMEFAFPGQTGFCGGYWSPLMIFLDDERPKFTGLSSFPLSPSGKTYWPEAGSKGYFLALDRNDNGLIDQKDELFGQNEGAENGFEALKKLDANNDGVIDAKDPEFKKLVLWNDANGDGVSDKAELIPVAKLVKSISLKYKKGDVLPIGRNAEARESSEVVLAKGKKRAKIIDIWLAPEK